MPSDLAIAAADYLRGGYHLLLLRGKRPHTKYHKEWDWDNSIHGDPMKAGQSLWDALADPTVTGIAILIPEHVLVADIDTHEAAQLFRDLAGDIPRDTAIARTTKGLHVWYVAPGAKASRWLGDRSLLFKGFGGYVAVEPSAHFTDDTLTEQDGSYQWLSPLTDGLAFLPEGISAMFAAADEMQALLPKRDHDDDMTRIELQLADGKWTGEMWPTWHMDGLAHAVETAKDGNQNNMIHWAACVARDGGVPYEVCMDILLAAALKGNHPKARAVSTIRGAYKRSRA